MIWAYHGMQELPEMRQAVEKIGELGTYSEELLAMYLDYMKVLKEEGKSISVMDREVMTKLYGYDSIESAENSL